MKCEARPMGRLLCGFLLGAMLAGVACADTITDTLFAERVFSTLPEGQEIRYALVRSGPDAPGFRPVTDGSIVVNKPTDNAPKLSLSLVTDGRSQTLADFSAEGGNPVLLIFLESVVQNMASLTGGSPFYIHNRIKDALGAGGTPTDVSETYADQTVLAQSVTLLPFEADPNADKMGDFAGLTLRLVVSAAVPGNIVSLSADTPDPDSGYHETIRLLGQGRASE
ncbi:MAG: hypothetical protein EON48_02300 [Acetobacteraceae bacterium]|nr:MAG: hypothetical protein EON48_02300 [Acetobacteraceae bacterium]